MARKNDYEEYSEENEVTVEEVTEGVEEAAKKKREPSPKTVAKNAIFSFVTDGNNRELLPEELQALVDTYNSIPGRSGSGAARESVASKIREMFMGEESIHEDRFYELFKIGRTEMKRRIYNLHKKNANPEDNIYVKFDPESCTYNVLGYGAEVPEGFND